MAHPNAPPSRGDVIAAIRRGEIEELRALVDAGGDLHFSDENGYDALIHAVYGEAVQDRDRLVALVQYLVSQRVPLSGVTRDSEWALGELLHAGPFEAVSLLLKAGADRSRLRWTPLHEAVAIGTSADVERAVASGEPLEATDCWSRTPLLLAIFVGDVAKVEILVSAGCNTDVRGHCGERPLHAAVSGGQTAMLQWLLQRGEDVNGTDRFGTTPLQVAVYGNELGCAEILIGHGADVGRGSTVPLLEAARSRAMALQLLEAGAAADAGPAALSCEVQRVVLGLGSPDESRLAHVSLEEFERDRRPTVGVANPTRVRSPYREAMIRAGVEAYVGRRQFDCDWPGMWPGRCSDGEGSDECATHQPDWCARRNGQSLTLVPDGRAIQIGGECEDSYHPDFCVYSDVFVHHPGVAPDGAIEMYEYPHSAFQPTSTRRRSSRITTA
jgi:ankyrin repeat protein